ncbi:MAG: pyridoxamine 5'-phosphate oxidase family protein [Theionarchaea archaeon]|nr:pyridoxamine 5'-phosphate oxidase family protein [Theionarchaea archaeon]
MDSHRDHCEKKFWRTAPELPQHVFEAWKKPQRALNPVALIATADPDGTPRTAPFGSLRAVTPHLLRFVTWHGHDTYRNISNNRAVVVFLLSPPDIAVSARGIATVIREHMETDSEYACVEVGIEEVKNDMVPRIIIEGSMTISVPDQHKEWFENILGEMEVI